MKFLFTKERVQKGFPELLLAATQRGKVLGCERKTDGTRTVTAMKDLHLSSQKLVEEGDYVISLRSFQGGIECHIPRGHHQPSLPQSYNLWTGEFCASPLITLDFSSLLTSSADLDLVLIYGSYLVKGQNIDYERLSRAYSLPLPPTEEQKAIGQFLGWANGRLDRAIRAKRKVIALLNEQKQVIIHRAVTRGLDPSVPLKPSGIPWLGDIPDSCGASRQIGRVSGFGRYSWVSVILSFSCCPSPSVVSSFVTSRRCAGKFSADMGTSQEVRSGDLVFCFFDVPETPRTVGLSQYSGMITGAYTVMECSDLGDGQVP